MSGNLVRYSLLLVHHLIWGPCFLVCWEQLRLYLCCWNKRLGQRVKTLPKWWGLPLLPDGLTLWVDPRLHKLWLTLLHQYSM